MMDQAPQRMAPIKGTAPEQKILTLYADEFLSSLAVQFGLEIEPTELAHELRNIGRQYLRVSGFRDNSDIIRKERGDYMRLNELTQEFIKELRAWAARDLAGDIAMIARASKEPPPSVGFPALTAFQRQRGDTYYHELLRLLGLVEKTSWSMAGHLTPRGGRPINHALEVLTRKTADFWTEKLGRRFTVDYHRGSGWTQAFEFVKALLKPLGDVPDKQIITAMRAEIKSRNSGRTTHKPPRINHETA
jgi:hypothetical protein